MSTFVLIPGAGGEAEIYWRDTVAELRARGHEALPVELREDDPALGLRDWAATVDDAIGARREVVLVAQSLGGFTAPMVGKRDAVARIVLVNAMVPLPGETPGEWFEGSGAGPARTAANERAGRSDDFDLDHVFFHDLPATARAEMSSGGRAPADAIFDQPCTFDAWPDVPIHVVVGADDRMFPPEFQIRLARERLGVEADVVPGGHLVARSRPADLAERLVGYLDDDPASVPFGLADAADSLRRSALAVTDEQLDVPTPCAQWTLRELLGHVRYLVQSFAHVARHEPVGLPDEGDDALPASWRDDLDRDLDALVAAWRDPAAWLGDAEAAGLRMPTRQWACVALDELVLHGWDLARATGRPFGATDHDVAVCTAFAASMASTDPSRPSPYGPPIAVGPDATPLEALLGLAGRSAG